jgi:DNA invertase Pin-like site-specific DNA recombinase
MAELNDQGVGLYLHQQNVDSSTATGKAMLAMCGVFAEFERSMVVERLRSGLQRARAQGTTLGRPRVSARTEIEIRRLRAKAISMGRVARELSVGVSSYPEDTKSTSRQRLTMFEDNEPSSAISGR